MQGHGKLEPDGLLSAPTPEAPAKTRIATIERGALIDRVLSIADCSAVFLSAPFGYGKSALLGQVAERLARTRPVIWLDPIYQGDGAVAAALENAKIDHAAAIIVDNVQSMPRSLAERLGRMIDRHAGRFPLILAGRGAGWLAVESLSLDGKLERLRAGDLLLENREIQAICNLTSLADASQISEIAMKAAGWPAALAALLRHPDEQRMTMPATVARLIEENVYRLLDDDIRAALERVSVFDEFAPAHLAANGHGVWSETLPDQIPLTCIDKPNRKYRFHPLFRQFLLTRLADRGSTCLAEMHKHAARALKAEGDHYRAASHAIESADRPFIIDMLDGGARHFIATGRIADAIRWLDYLGDLEENLAPRIRIYRVTALIISRRFAEAVVEHQALEAVVESHRKSDPAPAWIDEVEAQNRYHALLLAHFDPGLFPDRSQALRLVEDYRHSGRAIEGESLQLLAIIDLGKGLVDEAEASLFSSFDLLRRTGSWLALAYGQAALALIDSWRRSSGSAVERLENMLEELADHGISNAPAADLIRVQLARHLVQQCDYDRALKLLDGISPTDLELMDRDSAIEARLTFAAAAAARRDHDLSREILLGVATAQRPDAPAARELAMEMARQSLRAGDVARARAIVEPQRRRPHEDDRPSDTARLSFREQLLDIQIMLAGNIEQAPVSRLRQLVRRAGAFGIKPYIVEANCTLAFALAQTGQEAEAGRVLNEAVSLARTAECPHQLSSFPLGGFGQLLNEAMVKGDAQAGNYLRSLQNSGPTSIVAPYLKRTGAAAGDLLTAKEMEVLLLASLGQSNQCIADTLATSLATTKWHMRNILSKLDAANRSDAVAKARRANLIN